MSLPPLDNLVRIGQLKAEPPSQAEFDGLSRSGQVRCARHVAERIAALGPAADG